MARVAVVGVGHLGKEHARILSSMPGVELVGVADPNPAQAEAVAQRCGCRAFADHRELLGQVSAAVVAAPTCHHHAVALDLLRAGVHLLIEKPLAPSPRQAREIVEAARDRALVLQVGHIERFNPTFEELRRLSLRPRYVHAERLGGFTGRSTDVGVVLDLMIHDLDLVLGLVGQPAQRVEAIGVAVLGGHEDIAQARVTFAGGCVADLVASRVHPEPRRRLQVWGAEGFAGVDFARRSITLMQPGEALRAGRLDSRRLNPALAASLKAELFGRFVETAELDCTQPPRADQLTRELEEFVRCVGTGETPRADGRAGLAAVELASQVLDALRSHAWGDGAVGPDQLPTPLGRLFAPAAGRGAA
ncbi:MAG: Gfo/Idh/MocA family oxidoreductase [Gemmataceae bacterium]